MKDVSKIKEHMDVIDSTGATSARSITWNRAT